jgi:threonine dehydrogenase-like Zn-dependent dehydrogenase
LGSSVGVWVEGGGFADHVLCRSDRCFRSDLHAERLALLEPLACAFNAVESTAPAPGDAVVVVGGGFMGALVQLVAALRGPRIVAVVEPRPDARERALELGAHVAVGPDSARDVVAALTEGAGADVLFEVTGSEAALWSAGSLLRTGGKLAIVGYHQGVRRIPLGEWNWRAFELVNCHVRDADRITAAMRHALELVESGLVDPQPLVSHRYPLEAVAAAFRAAERKPEGFVKSVVLAA